MTEKRFTWLKKEGYAPQIVITDSLTEKDLTPTDCYDMLNELADENEQLRTKSNAYLQDIEVYREENTHLKLENGELKKEVKQLKNKIKTYNSTHELLKETIDRLRSDG